MESTEARLVTSFRKWHWN